jgi:RNA polymerase sigma-70 factor (ECF subfamily)
MSVECEQELVERAPGDPEAFRQLYKLYLPRVYAYVGYRVGDVQDTEDLVADIFLKIVEELDRFEWRHSNSFAAWVFRIAHNLVANFHRDTGRAGTSLPLDALPDVAANALLPVDLLLRKELFARLRDAVNSLPVRRREVVSLRYFAGLHNHEIAQVLGIDERTVGSTLSRALDELQRLLSTLDTIGSKEQPGR